MLYKRNANKLERKPFITDQHQQTITNPSQVRVAVDSGAGAQEPLLPRRRHTRHAQSPRRKVRRRTLLLPRTRLAAADGK